MTFETFDQHLQLQYWKLRTWINDNLCYLTINCDTGQHSQFLRCLKVLSHYEGLRRIPWEQEINCKDAKKWFYWRNQGFGAEEKLIGWVSCSASTVAVRSDPCISIRYRLVVDAVRGSCKRVGDAFRSEIGSRPQEVHRARVRMQKAEPPATCSMPKTSQVKTRHRPILKMRLCHHWP